MIIDNKYNFGQIVYLITDIDQQPRIVTEMKIGPEGCVIYELTCGTVTSYHYDFEMSLTVDVELKTR